MTLINYCRNCGFEGLYSIQSRNIRQVKCCNCGLSGPIVLIGEVIPENEKEFKKPFDPKLVEKMTEMAIFKWNKIRINDD